MFVALLALAIPPAHAQSAAMTLVSNTGQTALSANTSVSTHWIGTAFTTGNHAHGYTLSEVALQVGNWNGNSASFSANIYSASGSDPAAQLCTLVNPSSPADGAANTFTAPTAAGAMCPTLDASTTYFLVLKSSTNNAVTVAGTNSDDEDGGAAAGWSIADRRVQSNDSGATWPTATRVLMFAVLGEEAPAPPGPEVSSASVDGTTLEIVFDENLNTTSTPTTEAFLVTTSTGEEVTLAGLVAVEDAAVTLTLASYSRVRADETILVYYTQPSENPLKGANGGAVASFSRQAVTNNTDSERPELTAVALVSKPRLAGTQGGTKDTYGLGQNIVVDVTWDQDVTWDVSAANADIRVRLNIGGTNKAASLVTGGENTGTARTLRFRYMVEAGLSDTDGVEVSSANGNVVHFANNATLKNLQGLNAKRAHAGLTAQAAHKVASASGDPNAPANDAPTYDGPDPDSINAPGGDLVSTLVPIKGVNGATTGFSDPDGDLLTYTTSTDPGGTSLRGVPIYARQRLFFGHKEGCDLAHSLADLPTKDADGDYVHFTSVVLTATDPDGASVSTTLAARSAFTCGTVSNAELTGKLLTITLTDPPNAADRAPADEVLAADEFEVKVDGVVVALADTDPVTVSGSTITLALAETVPAGSSVTVSYAPGRYAAAVAFSDEAVTDNTSPHEPAAATVNGNFVTLTFNGNLTAVRDGSNEEPGAMPSNASALYRLRYAFRVDGIRHNGVRLRNVSPASVQVSGSTVTLRMGDTAALPGSTNVSVTYDAGTAAAAGVALRDADNVTLPSFTVPMVTNSTAGTVRPLITAAQVAGTELTLTFDQALDAGSQPAGSRFSVSVDPVDWYGQLRHIRGTGTATVSGTTVTVTLAAPVEPGEYAWAWYRSSDPNPLRAAAGAKPTVDDFYGSRAAVLDRTAPETDGIYLAGTKLVFYYDEALDTSSVPAASDFSVVTSTSQTVSGVAVNPHAVTLTLGSSIATSSAPAITYTPGTNPIRDTAGNNADALSSSADHLGNSDPGMPALTTTDPASADGSVLTLRFDQPLDPASVPAATAFTLSSRYQRVIGVAVRTLSVVESGERRFLGLVQLSLSPGVLACAGDLTVSYTKPTTGSVLENLWGTDAAAFSGQAVANANEDHCAYGIVGNASMGASGDGDRQVRVKFDRPLSPRRAPRTEYFAVASGSGAAAPIEVDDVRLTDDLTELLLTLNRPLDDGEEATVSYSPPYSRSALTDIDGNMVAGFSRQVEVTRPPTRPEISSVALVSMPGLDADGDGTAETYGAGEQVVVEVSWDQDVTWDVSAPGAELRMRLDVGGTRRLARLERNGAASGTARSLRFGYTVAGDDTDSDGVEVTPARGGGLVTRHRGATLRNSAGLNARLKHAGLAAHAGHQVSGAPVPPANRAPVYGGAAPRSVNAPPDTLVSVPVSKADFSDPDDDAMTFSLSASRDDVYAPGSLVYSERVERIVFVAKTACALAGLDPPLPEVYDTIVTMTATDPDGATAHTTVTFRTDRTDAVCPSFEAASVSGATLTIDLDAAPTAGYYGSAPTASEFDVIVDGSAASLADAEPVSASGTTIVLALAEPVTADQTIAVSHTPGDSPVVAAFANQPVANETPVPAEPAASDEPATTGESPEPVAATVPNGATVRGTHLTLTFNRDLSPVDDATAGELHLFFLVEGAFYHETPVVQSPGQVVVDGATITLTLGLPIRPGDDVIVTYLGDGGLRTADGTSIADFTSTLTTTSQN